MVLNVTKCIYFRRRLASSNQALWKEIFEFNKANLNAFQETFATNFDRVWEDPNIQLPPDVFNRILPKKKEFSMEECERFAKENNKWLICEVKAFLLTINKVRFQSKKLPFKLSL